MIIMFKEKMEPKKKKAKTKKKHESKVKETSSPTKSFKLNLKLQQIDLNSTFVLATSTIEEAEL